MRGTRLSAAAALLALLGGCGESTFPSPEVPRTGAAPNVTNPEHFPTVGEIRTGWIIGRDGQPMEVIFEVHNGRAIFEGDIDLGPVDQIPRTREQTRMQNPMRGSTIDGWQYRWSSGTVLYEIDPALPNQARVTDAIAHIEANNPGVEFVPRGSGQLDYIRFQPDNVCSSPIGRVGGQQIIRLADGCSTGSTVHELLHSLGMAHEQSRCHRDAFVQVLWDNIDPTREFNFYKAGSTTRTGACNGFTDVEDYVEGSIMHYGTHYFSANGQPTLRSLRGFDGLMGQRDGMSASDIATVELLYPTCTPLGGWIDGPPVVSEIGIYTYTAHPQGGCANSQYQYQWRARYHDGSEQMLGTAQSQDFFLNDWGDDPLVRLFVVVTSGSRTTERYIDVYWQRF
jgi:astacin